MDTSHILARIEETKGLIRHVRTPEGARRFKQPIGSVIVRDVVPSIARRGKRSKASQSDERVQSVFMAPNRPQSPQEVVRAYAVAPEPELDPYIPDESDAFPGSYTSGYKNRHLTPGITYYKNDAPMRSRLDMDYLKNATAAEAMRDLNDMGVQMRITPSFANDRDFMVGLAESCRVLDEMFPGFIYRHGNIFAGRTGMGRHSTGRNAPYAYNIIIRRDDPEDDSVTRGRSNVDDFSYDYMDGSGVTGRNATHSVHRRDVSGPIRVTGPNMNQTATTFLGKMIDDDFTYGYERGLINSPNRLSFFSMNDWYPTMREEIGPRMAAMMAIINHEFGHAINNTVLGNISFEIDGWKDPDTYKRRWYAEYGTNAMLDLFDDLGIVTRTNKRYDGADLAEQTRIYREYLEPKDQVNYDQTLASLKDYFEKMLADNPRPAMDAPGTEFNGFMDRWAEMHQKIIDDYEFNDYIKDILRDPARFHAFHERLDGGDEKFTKIFARSNTPDMPRGNTELFSSMSKNKSALHTFQAWKRAGYISDYDFDAWTRQVSAYGASKVVEFEAETWVSYMLDTEVTEATRRWGQMVHDMYSWWVEDDMDPEFGKNN